MKEIARAIRAASSKRGLMGTRMLLRTYGASRQVVLYSKWCCRCFCRLPPSDWLCLPHRCSPRLQRLGQGIPHRQSRQRWLT
jgi:hypothetical protein